MARYKVVQRTGDLDTANLTVYVAENAAAWKERYINPPADGRAEQKRIRVRKKITTLGRSSAGYLQPHLSQIQAVVRQEGQGASLVIDFQTKAYAAAIKSQAPPPSQVSPEP